MAGPAAELRQEVAVGPGAVGAGEGVDFERGVGLGSVEAEVQAVPVDAVASDLRVGGEFLAGVDELPV